MHYHITGRGHYTGTWDNAVALYKQIMRDPDSINFATVIREPRSHLIRYIEVNRFSVPFGKRHVTAAEAVLHPVRVLHHGEGLVVLARHPQQYTLAH